MTKTVEELTADLEKALTSIDKLTAKNSELITREKNAKISAEKAETAAETAAEEAARKANDLESLERTLEAKYAKQNKAFEDREAVSNQRLIDSTIRETLASGNVEARMIEPLTAMLKTGALVKDNVAMLGELSLADHVKTFLTNDSGKQYVSAPMNSGAGATGSSTVRTAHGFTKDNFTDRTGEWMMLAKSDPALAKSIASEVGRSDLANDL